MNRNPSLPWQPNRRSTARTSPRLSCHNMTHCLCRCLFSLRQLSIAFFCSETFTTYSWSLCHATGLLQLLMLLYFAYRHCHCVTTAMLGFPKCTIFESMWNINNSSHDIKIQKSHDLMNEVMYDMAWHDAKCKAEELLFFLLFYNPNYNKSFIQSHVSYSGERRPTHAWEQPFARCIFHEPVYLWNV